MVKLLLTGFEPFGGSDVNPSAEVLGALGRQSLGTDVTLVTATLPVARYDGPAQLLELVAQERPDLIICMGEARGRAQINLERIAINWLDFGAPDNRGEQPRDEFILADGPAGYFTTLPVRDIVTTLQSVGIPAKVSLTAGSYLCNQVTYELLDFVAQMDGMGYAPLAGFIHLPSLPEQVADKRGNVPSMTLDLMVKAIRIAIRVSIDALPKG